MKNTKIYHIDFGRDIDTVVWEYTCLPENERIKLTNLHFVTTFDFIDKQNNYHFVMVTEQLQMEKYLKILTDNLILHFSHNITDKLLRDELDLSRFEKVLDKNSKVMWEKFRTKVEEWMLINQELDNVLDIINLKGLEKLRNVDKKFLENYGK